jgi:hypothetical protein
VGKVKTRNKIIIFLIIIGIISYAIVDGVIIPKINENKQQYIAEQQNPSTHDIESILKYKNKYMGNASNTINLFHSLPLSNVGTTFQMFPDQLTTEVNYQETVSNIGTLKVQRALIYNATAAFALIDNLKSLNFKFDGPSSFKVNRKDIEKWYGEKSSSLLSENTWKVKVQTRLDNNQYVESCFKAIFTSH